MPGVCLSVCLSVCLFVCLSVSYWTYLHENLTTDVTVHKEELIRFWKSFVSGSGSRNLLKDSSTLRDRAFFSQCGLYLRRKWPDFHDSITDVPLDKEVPVKFLAVIWYELRIQTIFSLADVCGLRLPLSIILFQTWLRAKWNTKIFAKLFISHATAA